MISRVRLVTLRSLVLVAVGSLLVLVASQDVSGAGTFSPYGDMCLDDATTEAFSPADPGWCDGDTTPGAISDVRSSFNIDEGDYNFGGNVGFLPAVIVEQIDPNTPIGAVVAKLSSVARLGLLNNPCNNGLPVEFIMLNASTNISDEIFPFPPDKSNVLEPLADDDGVFDSNGDTNETSHSEAANNGIPDGVDKYPSYLNDLFDPDLDEGPDGIFRTGDDINGPLPPLTPVLRMVGTTLVPGVTDWIVLNFVIFEPGSDLRDFPPFAPSQGYLSAVVLQNPSAPASQSAISDFCSPLRTTTITFGVSRDNPCTPPGLGGLCPQRPPIDPTVAPALDADGCDGDLDESNCVIRKNPAEGCYEFITHTEGMRDADGDGIENFLDTCPLDATPDWDPRDFDPVWDPDGDGLVGKADGTGCDPNPNIPSQISSQYCPEGNTGPDEDGDCFSNRQDNCPLIANDQVDGDKDQVGDACDPHPDDEDAEGVEPMLDITWSLNIPGSPIADDGPCQVVTNGGDGGIVDGDGDGDGDGGVDGGADGGADGVTEEEFLETLAPGLNLEPTSASTNPGDSITLRAAFADDDGDPLTGVDITFNIKSQPGNDASLVFAGLPGRRPVSDGQAVPADLEGETEVTKTTDAAGLAKATLNVGSKLGTIEVEVTATDPATGEDQTKTITVTVVEAGPATGVGSLAPVASSIPTWAAIASALGGAGLLGSLGALASRVVRRRRQ